MQMAVYIHKHNNVKTEGKCWNAFQEYIAV